MRAISAHAHLMYCTCCLEMQLPIHESLFCLFMDACAMTSFVFVVVAIVAVADVCVLVFAIGLRLWFGCSCYSRLQAGSLESQRPHGYQSVGYVFHTNSVLG